MPGTDVWMMCIDSEAKGFAFVEFKNEREADDARHNLDGVRIDGREIRVVFAQERRKTTDQMRDRERYVVSIAGRCLHLVC